MNPKFTIGDLRRTLATTKAPWTINPLLQDSDPIPLHPLGGDKAQMRLATQVAKLDLRSVLGNVPNNPFLQQRRVARGLLNAVVLTPTPVGSTPVIAAPTTLLDPDGTRTSPPPPIQITAPQVPSAAPPASAVEARAIRLPVAGTPEAAAHPTSIDWRTRWGWPWITTVQNQAGNNCWAMAAAALVETMVRINHSVWSKCSEGDVHDGMGAPCPQLGSTQAALDWIKNNNGIADLASYPSQCHLPYVPTPDRAGRTVKIDNYTWLSDIEQQKIWIDTVGPIVTWFDVWHDFDLYHAGVYKKQAMIGNQPNYERGGHLMLVVGYDDTQGCWICKNSWGSGFGMGGYVNIGYGESGIDTAAKIGLQMTNPDPQTKRRLHSGCMIESGNGVLHRNWELMVRNQGQVQHRWHDGSDGSWHIGGSFANDVRSFPGLTASTWNRNFEVVYRTTTNRMHHWAFNQSPGQWWDGGVFGPTDVAGIPSIVQGNYGAPANLELVVPTADGRLNHWWGGGGAWHDGGRFGSKIAHGGALVQGRSGTKGNLELVCSLANGQMQHWYRDDDQGFVWKLRSTFGSGITGSPYMIEGQYGATNEKVAGHYELCVATGGHIQHWWFDTNGGSGWHYGSTFGSNVWSVVAFVEGSYSFHFELIVLRTDMQIQHYFSDAGGWHAGEIVGSVA